MFKTLAKVFKMNLYGREIENAENLKFILMQAIPTIRVLKEGGAQSLPKFRNRRGLNLSALNIDTIRKSIKP
jgi:hypothetical protein